MQMFDLPVRHQQPLFIIVISLPIGHAIKVALNKRAVVGMDPLHDDIERRLDRSFEPHDVVGFLRPVNLASSDFPAEASGESERLCLGQISLATLQGSFSPLSILDVGIRSIPSDDISSLIAQR